MKKYDFYLLIFIFSISAVLFALTHFGHTPGKTVIIRLDGKIYQTLPLSEDTVCAVNDTNTVTIQDKKAFMSEATCPDKLCIHQGKTDSPDKTIICLPNRVSISVE